MNGLGFVAVGQKELYIEEFVIAPSPKVEKKMTETPVVEESTEQAKEKPEEVVIDEQASE